MLDIIRACRFLENAKSSVECIREFAFVWTFLLCVSYLISVSSILQHMKKMLLLK